MSEHALRKYREEHELTIEEFGTLIGASKSMISKWERGQIPRRAHMEKIMKVTDNAVGPLDWYQKEVEAAKCG